MLVYYMFQSWKMSLDSFYLHFELVVVLFLWLFFVQNHRFWSIFPMKTSLTTDNQLWWNMNQNKIENLQANLILSYWNPYNDFDITYPYLVLVRLVLLQLHLKFSIKDWCYLIMTYLIKGNSLFDIWLWKVRKMSVVYLLASVLHLELQWPHRPCPPICFPSPSTRTEHHGFPLWSSCKVQPLYFLPLYMNGITHNAPVVPPPVVLHRPYFDR